MLSDKEWLQIYKIEWYRNLIFLLSGKKDSVLIRPIYFIFQMKPPPKKKEEERIVLKKNKKKIIQLYI